MMRLPAPLLGALVSSLGFVTGAFGRELTVCADPNNLPFSNRSRQGFENKIAQLIGKDLGAKVSYVWWAQRRGYLRHTVGESKCDIWPGIATGTGNIVTTRPYYSSEYVFVTRADEPLQGLTLDDPRLKSLSIGVQLIGDNAMNTPPAHAMARRGIVRNVHGYMLYGDYTEPNPPARIVDAVVNRDIQVALVWGPLAGYCAGRSKIPLRLEPVTPRLDAGQWPMSYDISVGVRKDETELRGQIEEILEKEKPRIGHILHAYNVPVASG